MKMHIIDLVLLVVRMAGVLILGLLVFFLQTYKSLEGISCSKWVEWLEGLA